MKINRAVLVKALGEIGAPVAEYEVQKDKVRAFDEKHDLLFHERVLKKLLRHLKKQGYKGPAEIIIANNACLNLSGFWQTQMGQLIRDNVD